jgi:hypothetical protein
MKLVVAHHSVGVLAVNQFLLIGTAGRNAESENGDGRKPTGGDLVQDILVANQILHILPFVTAGHVIARDENGMVMAKDMKELVVAELVVKDEKELTVADHVL